MYTDIFINANETNSEHDKSYLKSLLFKCSDKDITLYVDLYLLFIKIPYVYNMIYNFKQEIIIEEDFTSDIVKDVIYLIHNISKDITSQIVILMDKWCIDLSLFVPYKIIHRLINNKDNEISKLFDIEGEEHLFKDLSKPILLKDSHIKLIEYLVKTGGIIPNYGNHVKQSIYAGQKLCSKLFMEIYINSKYDSAIETEISKIDSVLVIFYLFKELDHLNVRSKIKFKLEDTYYPNIKPIFDHLRINHYENFLDLLNILFCCNLPFGEIKSKTIYNVIFNDHLDIIRSLHVSGKISKDFILKLFDKLSYDNIYLFTLLYNKFYDIYQDKIINSKHEIQHFALNHPKTDQSIKEKLRSQFKINST